MGKQWHCEVELPIVVNEEYTKTLALDHITGQYIKQSSTTATLPNFKANYIYRRIIKNLKTVGCYDMDSHDYTILYYVDIDIDSIDACKLAIPIQTSNVLSNGLL